VTIPALTVMHNAPNARGGRRGCGLPASRTNALDGSRLVFQDLFSSFAAQYDGRCAKELASFRIERIARAARAPWRAPAADLR